MTYRLDSYNTFFYLKHIITNNTNDNIELFYELDSWQKRLFDQNNISFRDGLLGYGWLISYLGNKDIIEIEIDEYLYKTDDIIYKHTIKLLSDDFFCPKDFLYYINYYQQRLSTTNKHNLSRNFIFYDLLIYLANRCNSYLDDTNNIFENLDLTLKILLKFCYLSRKVLGDKLFEDNFYRTIEFIIQKFGDDISNFGNSANEIQKSVLRLLIITRFYDNTYWTTKIEDLCSKCSISLSVANRLENFLLIDVYKTQPSCNIDLNGHYLPLVESFEENSVIFELISNIYPFEKQ